MWQMNKVALGERSQQCEPGQGLGKELGMHTWEAKQLQVVCHLRNGLAFTIMPKLKG